MPKQPINFPVIVWTNSSVFREHRVLFGGRESIEEGYFNHALIIDRNGACQKILSASCGGIYFENLLALESLFFPASRTYLLDVVLSEPEQLELDTTKRQLEDCILRKRWHHTGRGISSAELLAPIRDARSFAELVDNFDYVFGS